MLAAVLYQGPKKGTIILTTTGLAQSKIIYLLQDGCKIEATWTLQVTDGAGGLGSKVDAPL